MVFSYSYFYVSIDLVMDDDWKVVVVACHPVLLSLPLTASSLVVDFEFCQRLCERFIESSSAAFGLFKNLEITQKSSNLEILVQFGD